LLAEKPLGISYLVRYILRNICDFAWRMQSVSHAMDQASNNKEIFHA
jgi:hypothetical protein